MKKGTSGLIFLGVTMILVTLMLALCFAVAYATKERSKPTAVKNGYTIVLDAGHGGEDGGASSDGGIVEKNLNLSITMKIGKCLEEKGVRVAYTRTEDVLLYDRTQDFKGKKKILDLAARVKKAREYENGIFVSIHMNSFPQKQYSGLQVYYSPHHPLSQTLALSIQNNTKKYLDSDNQRKIKKADSSIYLLDRLEMPAVLVECGFLSNDAEAQKLANDEYQNNLAMIIAESILESVKATD